ncbi:MerR family DNA-binding protein [Conexibacter sp. DBS9H8]|uniref:MerR family DNA-binding protein n=1 Tax=Conexibacter sp. DBS9H8 TaxID=2937801 RepID=UPI00200DF861|nr:MerR family DNA-binding protein [Conexibacter sp. DBS9H8]
MERTVTQIAAAVGLPSRTVRYYDSIGLVSPSARSDAGYRLYDAEAEGKLRFVRQAKALGFSLEEVRQLIAAAESGCCGQVVPELQRLLSEKVAEIDQRIGELSAFRQHLVDYAEGDGGGCGCQGHGAFCGCLSDVPLLQINNGKEDLHV